MVAYVIRRLFAGVVMLIVMSLVTFLLFFASPVDPAQFSCGKNCSPALKEQTRKALGYPPRDKGPYQQYVAGPIRMWGKFVEGTVSGRQYPDDPALRSSAPQLIASCPAPCFGYSIINNTTVLDEIKTAAPVSLSVGMLAIILWLFFGVLWGVISAVLRGSIWDRAIVGTSLFLYAFPVFFIGTFLIDFVSIKWGLWPYPNYTKIADGGVGQWAVNLFLPGLTLAVFYMAAYVRMTRSFVLESMGEDYIRTARAKGLPARTVLFKHGLRAALTPVVTMAGLDIAQVLGGAIITESTFNYPGLGKLAVDAQRTYDLPTLIGLVLLLGALVIVANIIVDVLYAVIDPRVRIA